MSEFKDEIINNLKNKITNDLKIFQNESFGKIRIVLNNDLEPLFCLVDVCRILKLQPSAVTQRLDKGVVSNYPLQTTGGLQKVNFVNEDGLYDVILDSRKPEAKKFRKWITSEVLPTIRRQGAYISESINEEQLKFIWENSIIELIVSGRQIGKIINLKAKDISPDELLASLVYIYDNIKTKHREAFLDTMIRNISEIRSWYRKSDDVDFNSIIYERYSIVSLFLINEKRILLPDHLVKN